MKQGIHPDYHPVVFRDRAANLAFLTRSTATSERTITWEDGRTYPVVDVEISIGEPPVLHRADARPRHGRAGGAVPPPVRQQRQGGLTTSGSLRAPSDHGPSDSEIGRPVPVSSSSGPRRPVTPVVPGRVPGQELLASQDMVAAGLTVSRMRPALTWRALDGDLVAGEVSARLRPDNRWFLYFDTWRADACPPLANAVARDLGRDLHVTLEDAEYDALDACAEAGFAVHRRESYYRIPTDPAVTGLAGACAASRARRPFRRRC